MRHPGEWSAHNRLGQRSTDHPLFSCVCVCSCHLALVEQWLLIKWIPMASNQMPLQWLSLSMQVELWSNILRAYHLTSFIAANTLKMCVNWMPIWNSLNFTHWKSTKFKILDSTERERGGLGISSAFFHQQDVFWRWIGCLPRGCRSAHEWWRERFGSQQVAGLDGEFTGIHKRTTAAENHCLKDSRYMISPKPRISSKSSKMPIEPRTVSTKHLL